LKKDKLEAEKYGFDIKIIQSDMRDLSKFEDQTFDVVYQPYSINYVPEVKTVIEGVSRILKPGGVYHVMFHNPFVQGSWKDSCWGSEWDQAELWHGIGYPISQPYQDGLPIKVADQTWNFEDTQGKAVKTTAPQEFKHTLSTILNTLVENHMSLLKFEEYTGDPDETSVPGTWDHYASVAAPWLFLWAKKAGI
jgi:SAM-dependent methyltransferase